MPGNKSLSKVILSSKILFLLALFILVFFSVNLVKEVVNKRDLQQDINKLQAEINSLENRNEELSGLIDYFNSMDFVETEARIKLNLKKPGESIIIVPEEENINNYQDGSSLNRQLISQSVKDLSNPLKWRKYFFSF